MKPCTIYGCAAAAPRNSKVCFEHIKAGLLSNPLEVHFDRGASSLSFTNNTDKEVSISATLISGGGLWTLSQLISQEIDNEILKGIIADANRVLRPDPYWAQMRRVLPQKEMNDR